MKEVDAPRFCQALKKKVMERKRAHICMYAV